MRNIWFLSPLVPSKREKNIQTETNSVCIYFSRFEGTREDKNQIFRTLENCEEPAQVEFHNVGKMNRSTSKLLNQGDLLKGIGNKTILEDRDLEGSLPSITIFISKRNGSKL